MSDRYLRFERAILDADEMSEVGAVADLAAELASFMSRRSLDIDKAHVFRAGSKKVQNVVGEFLLPKGFVEEYRVSGPGAYAGGARADFFGHHGSGRGVLVEVERGGVHTNNHDLKDLWKAHLSPEVGHLFLIVPMANWKTDGAPRERPFKRMPSRFQAFFADQERWVDLLSLHVFGYGPEQQLIEGVTPAR